MLPNLSPSEIAEVLTFVLSHCMKSSVHFLWRPYLPDADDHHVLEAALAGRASVLITHNTRHFPAVEELGIGVMTPGRFLRKLQSV
jgi:predicted nucleic acid-binding protein